MFYRCRACRISFNGNAIEGPIVNHFCKSHSRACFGSVSHLIRVIIWVCAPTGELRKWKYLMGMSVANFAAWGGHTAYCRRLLITRNLVVWSQEPWDVHRPWVWRTEWCPGTLASVLKFRESRQRGQAVHSPPTLARWSGQSLKPLRVQRRQAGRNR